MTHETNPDTSGDTGFNTQQLPLPDGQTLAYQHQPDSSGSATVQVVFCGGFHSSMMGTKASILAEHCAINHVPFLRFDYRAHGLSQGDALQCTLHDWLEDTMAILDAHPMPTVLIGSSMGAWLATLATLQKPDQIKGLLLLAAAPDFLQELVQPRLGPAEIWDLQQGEAIGLASGYDEDYFITQALLDSGKDLSVLKRDSLAEITCPLRLVHGSDDRDVPYSLALRL